MQRISLSVIAQAVFGIADPDDVREAQRLGAEYMDSLHPAILFFPQLRRDLLGLSPWARSSRAKQALDEVLYTQIKKSRARPLGEDILSLMLGARYEDGSAMSDEQIHDELLTLLLAGHETTALSLAWLFYHLYRNPETLVRLRRELDALGPDPEPELVAGCRYLEACCNETLRIYPIVGEVFRLLRAPLALGPYTVPKGYAVSVSAIGLHRHPELYPDGETFRPERFLERKFTPFEFVPFGGGARRCLGAAFAMYEMKLVAHAVLSRCELAPASSRPIRPAMRGPTFGPKGGVPMRYLGPRARVC
jgi:cytochrome P450